MVLDINGITASFYTSEAAFQSIKWWNDSNTRNGFEQARTGNEAYNLTKNLKYPDGTYAGLTQDGAMYEVLLKKFSNRELQRGLLATGDAYLLEHNPKKGRDKMGHWSDDYDGEGENMLGKTLMRVRAHYKGQPNPCSNCEVRDFSTAVINVLAKGAGIQKNNVE